MRWFKVGLLAAPIAAFSLALLTAGCGGTTTKDDDEYKPPKRRGGGGATTTVQEELRKPVAAEAGQYTDIAGKVTISGVDATVLTELTQKFFSGMSAVAYCTSGNAYSRLSPLEKQQQDYRVGPGNTLGNVFVWIEPLNKDLYFPIAPERLKEVKDQKKMISQPHCVFLPHCTVLFPRYYDGKGLTPTGEKLIVENDAFVGHNAKIGNSDLGTIPARTKPEDKPQDKEVALMPQDLPIIISCNVHSWMKGYILARDHPYTAATSVGADLAKKVYENPAAPDFGTFVIKGAPVGAKVRLKAWHERAGWITPPAGKEVTITKGMRIDDLAATFK